MIQEVDKKRKFREELGNLIKSNRKSRERTQRGLAKAINLPNSNLKYIEDGINAPSPEVYKKIVQLLEPSDEERKRMDCLYSQIRGTPPPDICEFLLENNGIFKAIRKNKYKLTSAQIERLNILLEIFAKENANNREETDNG